MSICATCNQERETRPYGMNGAPICFNCAMATPESQAEAERQLAVQIEAAAKINGRVIIGEETGPRPGNPENLS